MTPDVIAGIATLNELDIFALTDHNSALNCVAAEKAALAYGINFIAGIELTTAEDVHLVCLFPSSKIAVEFSNLIYNEYLPKIKNKEHIFGQQLVCDELGNIISNVENLLITGISLSLFQCAELVKEYNGFSFPAHVEKESNGIFPILGGIPVECDFSVLESKNINKISSHPIFKHDIEGKKIISSSDAHYPYEISRGENTIEAEGLDFYSIRKALVGY